MANPALSNNPAFKNAPSAPQFGGSNAAMTAEQLGQMYNQPSAGPVQTGRMTYDDVVMKSALMFGLLLVAAAVSWFTQNPLLMIVGAVGGLILGLVNAFKKEPSPALMLAYAGLQGLFVGGISAMFDAAYNGIVVQAVLATLSVFGVMLFAYKSGKIRVTPKFQRIMMLAVGGYMVFCLINLGLSLFMGMDLRGGMLGLAIGAVGAGLAAFSLVMDFDFIDNGVRSGLPEKYAWTAAFGLMVTLIWLYIEILRILAILRGQD